MRRFALLLGLVVCSGACGLTYQVLWLRQLSLVFGVTAYAASTVLSAFMTGLAAGSLAAPWLAGRFRRPLAIFGAAEILIGICAFATPDLLHAAESLYAALHARWPENLALLTIARAAGAFLVLFVPTFLMGVTLPVLSSSALLAGPRLASSLSALYAANTAGAVVGVLVTGYYLIGGLGMGRTFLIAAGVNVIVGVAALAMSRRPGVDRSLAPTHTTHGEGETGESGAAVGLSGRVRPLVFLVAAATGLAALALEVVWFRILLQYLAATTYAFSTMLATVLGGIAIGGAIAARRLRRERDAVSALVSTLVWTGTAVVMSQVFLAWSYGAGWRTSGLVQAAAAAILPAAILMGVTFPLLLKLGAEAFGGVSTEATAVARGVGRVYALNVGGAIVGALAGGFVLLPALGSRTALVALAALYPALVLILLRTVRRRPAMNVLVASVLFAVFAALVRDPVEAATRRRHGADFRELWREEGAQTSVSIQSDGATRVMFLDGVHQASDTEGVVLLHRVIAHLPMVLHTGASDVLVIGLGGGATPGAFSRHPDARVDVVELSPSVVAAAPFFQHINYDALRQPNVRMREDDGRNFLALTNRRFDVITADTIHPENAGAGNLYSREYFHLVRGALKPGGLVVQWIGHRPEAHYKLIMRTFLDVFPHATLWFGGTLLVGSTHAQAFDLDRVVTVRNAGGTVREALDAVGLMGPDALRSWFTAGGTDMRRFVGAGPILTDDRPLLEFHRSIASPGPPIDSAPIQGAIEPYLLSDRGAGGS